MNVKFFGQTPEIPQIFFVSSIRDPVTACTPPRTTNSRKFLPRKNQKRAVSQFPNGNRQNSTNQSKMCEAIKNPEGIRDGVRFVGTQNEMEFLAIIAVSRKILLFLCLLYF